MAQVGGHKAVIGCTTAARQIIIHKKQQVATKAQPMNMFSQMQKWQTSTLTISNRLMKLKQLVSCRRVETCLENSDNIGGQLVNMLVRSR